MDSIQDIAYLGAIESLQGYIQKEDISYQITPNPKYIIKSKKIPGFLPKIGIPP